jgi:hypothetical protein
MAELENDDVVCTSAGSSLIPLRGAIAFSQAPGPDMVFSEPLCHDGQGQEPPRPGCRPGASPRPGLS